MLKNNKRNYVKSTKNVKNRMNLKSTIIVEVPHT